MSIEYKKYQEGGVKTFSICKKSLHDKFIVNIFALSRN